MRTMAETLVLTLCMALQMLETVVCGLSSGAVCWFHRR